MVKGLIETPRNTKQIFMIIYLFCGVDREGLVSLCLHT